MKVVLSKRLSEEARSAPTHLSLEIVKRMVVELFKIVPPFHEQHKPPDVGPLTCLWNS